jgi:hypothetical protein
VEVLNIPYHFAFSGHYMNNGKRLSLISDDFNEIKPLNMFGLVPALGLEFVDRQMVVRGGTCKRKFIIQVRDNLIPVFVYPACKIAIDDFFMHLALGLVAIAKDYQRDEEYQEFNSVFHV